MVSWGGGEPVVGRAAQRQAAIYPKKTVYATKRLIGRSFDSDVVRELQKQCHYKIIDKDHEAWCEIEGKVISPVEIASIILKKIKSDAANALGVPSVDRAVITVPAFFCPEQRKATVEAGKLAGFTVESILDEPTAAAFAFGVGAHVSPNQKKVVAVYDLGGGTFDCSILELKEGTCTVKATGGNTVLGGEDFDYRILQFLKDHVQKKEQFEWVPDVVSLQRLREAAESTKIKLSFDEIVTINLPYIGKKNGRPIHLRTSLSRSRYEELVDDLIQNTIPVCETCVKQSNYTIEEIDEVLLVGGMTRTPSVISAVEKFFNKNTLEKTNPFNEFRHDESVAIGAGIKGAILSGKFKGMNLAH